MSARESVSTGWHIAQINVAKFREARDHPINADFESALNEVNALAEAAPGFVWRMQGEGGSDDHTLTINMTVWESIDALAAFAYRNHTHRAVMRRRADWFVPMPAYLVLWWVRAGQVPDLNEGMAKLELIGRLGPTAQAFDFRNVFAAPE